VFRTAVVVPGNEPAIQPAGFVQRPELGKSKVPEAMVPPAPLTLLRLSRKPIPEIPWLATVDDTKILKIPALGLLSGSGAPPVGVVWAKRRIKSARELTADNAMLMKHKDATNNDFIFFSKLRNPNTRIDTFSEVNEFNGRFVEFVKKF
jgi:hypothetical protein